MDNKFVVKHQGAAAYLITIGFNKYEISLSKEQRPIYLFDMDRAEGKRRVDQFFTPETVVSVMDFYGNAQKLRGQVWEAKEALKNATN
jgi:hypothetical protein